MENNNVDEWGNLITEQKESIKLVKGAKDYRWEIRLLDLNLDRLEALNNEMKRRFEKPDLFRIDDKTKKEDKE